MPEAFRERFTPALRVLLGKPLPVKRIEYVRPITSEEVAEAQSFFPLKKFFIFGHARSGTTVLVRLVRLHPEVHCNYQAHFFTRPPLLQSLVSGEDVREWLARGSNRWNRGKDLSPVVLRAVADYILERDARQANKLIAGDKSPNSLMDGEAVRLMHRIYPDAKLITVVRDGRDTAISHRIQMFIDRPEKLSKEDLRIRADFTRDPQPFLNGEHSIFTEKALLRAAQGWARNVKETDHEGKSLYGQGYLAIRFEDLLTQTWQEMQSIWEFLGATPTIPELESDVEEEMNSNPDAEWQQEKAGEIANSLQKGIYGNWREMFTNQDREIFQHVAGETLHTWGYETKELG